MMGNTILYPFWWRAARAESPRRARSASGARPPQAAAGGNRTQQHRAVAHLPQPVLAFLDADRLTGQCSRDVDEPATPLDLAVGPYTLDNHAAAVLGRVQAAAPAPRRGRIQRRRHSHAQSLVRTLLVVDLQEGPEAPPLRSQRCCRRARRLLCQRQVQPLQPAVLLRARRIDPFRKHTRLDQAHRQRTEPARSRRGKRRSVVGADHLGQPVLPERRSQHGPDMIRIHTVNRNHANEIAARLILQRQRIAAPPVAGAEPALEVHAPGVVGTARRSQRCRARSRMPAPLAQHRQALAPQQVPNRARRRPHLVRTGLLQPSLQLLGAPRRMTMPQLHDRLSNLRAQRMRAAMRRMAPLGQSRCSCLLPARQYRITALPAHPEPTAQLRHRCLARLIRHAEPSLLRHQTGLRPSHRPNLHASSNHTDLLPILPVYSVTHHAGSDRLTSSPPKGRGAQSPACKGHVRQTPKKMQGHC